MLRRMFHTLVNNACPVRGAAPGKHSATVIFLHGFGDTGDGWLQLISDICPHHIKVVCPNAPIRHVSLYGVQMPCWFDKISPSFDSEMDECGIVNSTENLNKYIDAEVKNGIPYNRIVIGGFSQGGASSLHTFLTNRNKLAGFIGLSTYLPVIGRPLEMTDENKDTKVFLAHGTSDTVVRFKFGEKIRDTMKTHYTDIQWNRYDGMDHSSDPREMRDLEKFIENVLPKMS